MYVSLDSVVIIGISCFVVVATAFRKFYYFLFFFLFVPPFPLLGCTCWKASNVLVRIAELGGWFTVGSHLYAVLVWDRNRDMGQSGTEQSRMCPILFMSGTFWDTFFWPELNIILAGINMVWAGINYNKFLRDKYPGHESRTMSRTMSRTSQNLADSVRYQHCPRV